MILLLRHLFGWLGLVFIIHRIATTILRELDIGTVTEHIVSVLHKIDIIVGLEEYDKRFRSYRAVLPRGMPVATFLSRQLIEIPVHKIQYTTHTMWFITPPTATNGHKMVEKSSLPVPPSREYE